MKQPVLKQSIFWKLKKLLPEKQTNSNNKKELIFTPTAEVAREEGQGEWNGPLRPAVHEGLLLSKAVSLSLPHLIFLKCSLRYTE